MNDVLMIHLTSTTPNAAPPINVSATDGLDDKPTASRPKAATVANVTIHTNEYVRYHSVSPSFRASAADTITGTFIRISATPIELRIGTSGVSKPIRAAQYMNPTTIAATDEPTATGSKRARTPSSARLYKAGAV